MLEQVGLKVGMSATQFIAYASETITMDVNGGYVMFSFKGVCGGDLGVWYNSPE